MTPRALRAGVVLLLTSALLTACSGSDGENDGDKRDSAERVAYEEWRPRDPIEYPTFSEADDEKYRDKILAEVRESTGIDESPPDLVRWTTRDEHDEALAECMTEGGFPAEVSPEGGVDYDPPIPEEQQGAYDLVSYRCEAQYTLHVKYTVMTDAQKGVEYDYYVEWLVPCLEELGYKITEAPSREVFIAEWPGWWPSDEASAQSTREEGQETASTCPPNPPEVALYG